MNQALPKSSALAWKKITTFFDPGYFNSKQGIFVFFNSLFNKLSLSNEFSFIISCYYFF